MLPASAETASVDGLLRFEAKNITISKNNISTNIFFRLLSVVVSKNYVTNAITLCSVCRITVDGVEVVKMRYHAKFGGDR